MADPACKRDDDFVATYAEGDHIEVTAGPFEGFSGFVVNPVDGADDLVAVVLNVFGRRVPRLLPRDQLGPDDGDGSGGVREPRTPKGPSDTHTASIELSDPQPNSN